MANKFIQKEIVKDRVVYRQKQERSLKELTPRYMRKLFDEILDDIASHKSEYEEHFEELSRMSRKLAKEKLAGVPSNFTLEVKGETYKEIFEESLNWYIKEVEKQLKEFEKEYPEYRSSLIGTGAGLGGFVGCLSWIWTAGSMLSRGYGIFSLENLSLALPTGLFFGANTCLLFYLLGTSVYEKKLKKLRKRLEACKFLTIRSYF